MNSVKWLPFPLSDDRFFKLESTKTSIDKIKIEFNGIPKYPYISRTEKNNGINLLIPKQKKDPNKGNVITIGLDTQTVFYQDIPFYTGQNIQVLSMENMTRNIALFLIPLIKKQLRYLSWGGTGATLSRLRSKSILLPVNSQDLPDWNYMEQFVQEKMEQLKQRKSTYSIERLDVEPKPIDHIKWSEFKINQVFNVATGNYIPAKKLKSGDIPRITAKSVDNGISAYYADHEEAMVYQNAITASFLGNYFYHPYKFTVDMKIHVLTPMNHVLNKYTGLFLVTILKKNINTYNYGNQLSSSDIKAKIIKLPIDKHGNPDWDYMRNYMIKRFNIKFETLLGTD